MRWETLPSRNLEDRVVHAYPRYANKIVASVSKGKGFREEAGQNQRVFLGRGFQLGPKGQIEFGLAD